MAALAGGESAGPGGGLARGDRLHPQPELVSEGLVQVQVPLGEQGAPVGTHAGLGEARDLLGQHQGGIQGRSRLGQAVDEADP